MNKRFRSISFESTRELVDYVNSNNIEKEDIITILIKNNYILFYYK